MFVHPSFRGQGIGKDLIQKRIDLAYEHHVSRVFVSCYGGSPVSHLYAQRGFLPLFRLGPRYYGGYAETLMAKEIFKSG